MDISIIITVVSIIITIISVIITIFQLSEKDNDFRIPKDETKKNLEGEWVGKFQQFEKVNGLVLNGEISFKFKIKKNNVQGEVMYEGNSIDGEDGKNYNESLKVKGGFRYYRFLYLEYQNKNKGKTQFGAFILELSSDSEFMEGKLVGFGHKTNRIVSGKVKVYKK